MKMELLFRIILVIAVPAICVRGSELEEISTLMKNQLDESVAEYDRIWKEIAEEKVPLVREVNALEIENIRLRKEVQRHQSSTQRRQEELKDLKKEAEDLRSQTDYIHSVFHEYLQNFESKLHIAEDQQFKESITEIRSALGVEELGLDGINDQYAKILNLGLTRQESLVGGYRISGRSIDSDGNVLSGEIAVMGPSAYFSSASDDAGGLLIYHSGTLEPGIARFDPVPAASVRNFIQSGQGEIPLDASLGNAISLQAINITLAEHIHQGGPVGYAILILGGIALLLSLVKVIDLSRHAVVTPNQVREIARCARSESREEAMKKIAGIKGSIGEMIQVGIENVHSGAVFLEEMMLSVIARKRPQLERFMPFVSITAMAAPLMGLLGTVVGMIKTFALITVFGTGDPKALSSGISEALVTTELGLIVAIVALLLHAVFARIIKSRLGSMEQVAFDFVRSATFEEAAKP